VRNRKANLGYQIDERPRLTHDQVVEHPGHSAEAVQEQNGATDCHSQPQEPVVNGLLVSQSSDLSSSGLPRLCHDRKLVRIAEGNRLLRTAGRLAGDLEIENQCDRLPAARRAECSFPDGLFDGMNQNADHLFCLRSQLRSDFFDRGSWREDYGRCHGPFAAGKRGVDGHLKPLDTGDVGFWFEWILSVPDIQSAVEDQDGESKAVSHTSS